MSAALMEQRDGLALHIEAVARELMGEPNAQQSKANDLRFGNHGSMSVDLACGTWFDHEATQGGGVLDLIVHRGEAKDRAHAARWMEARGLVQPAAPLRPARMVKTYDYTSADGEILFQVCRMEPKRFMQRRPDGAGWSWSVKGIEQVPYRLPAMLADPAATVYVVEGEKDADNLAALGLVATTNAGGAGKFRDELVRHFKGRRVVILPDNDNAGRNHAQIVVGKLRNVAADVRTVDLPGLADKGDVSDWLAAGGTAEQLQRLAEALPVVAANDGAVVDLHALTVIPPMDFPHTSEKGQPLNVIPNLAHLLRHYEITARYDVIRKDLVITHPGQRGTRDNVRGKSLEIICSLCALNRLPRADAPGQLLVLADDAAWNPVVDFIQSRPWDGHSRFADLMATVQTKAGYSRDLFAMLLRRWLISAVAAAAMPTGFWSKGVLVFQGAQSLGKTSWFRSLLPAGLRDLVKVDAHIDPSNKDTIISAVSHWLVELGELDGTLRKTDIARLKGFISQDVDSFRRPYGRTEEKFQRRTVFFASVNPEQFLADDTGNVRWWTVPVVAIDADHGIDMQQLWAEVMTWQQSGERHWLDLADEQLLEGANADHEQADPVADLIVARYDFTGGVRRKKNATEILLELGFANPDAKRLAAASKAMRRHFGEPTRTGRGRWFTVPALLRPDY